MFSNRALARARLQGRREGRARAHLKRQQAAELVHDLQVARRAHMPQQPTVAPHRAPHVAQWLCVWGRPRGRWGARGASCRAPRWCTAPECARTGSRRCRCGRSMCTPTWTWRARACAVWRRVGPQDLCPGLFCHPGGIAAHRRLQAAALARGVSGGAERRAHWGEPSAEGSEKRLCRLSRIAGSCR